MSYVKYREDDIKIINHRIHMSQGSFLRKKKSILQYHECRYCHQLFTDKMELFRHIREFHNIVRPIIIINDKVIGDYTVLQYIQQAKILMYGFDGEIWLGGKRLQYDDNEEVDITEKLNAELSKRMECTISFKESSVTIVKHSLSVDNNLIIKSAIEAWQNSAAHEQTPDMSYLRKCSGGDLLFLEGIYNYYLACTAERYKAKRYDDAYSALTQFNDLDGIGKCILKAIAFRRNWIGTLHLQCDGEQDVFSTACEYFDGQKSLFEYENDDNVKQLYVEHNTKMSLDLIVLFQKGKIEDLKLKISSLGNIDNFDDPNFVEQLYLLKAKIAAAEGDRVRALRYCEGLIAPAFQEEYRRYL